MKFKLKLKIFQQIERESGAIPKMTTTAGLRCHEATVGRWQVVGRWAVEAHLQSQDTQRAEVQ